MALARPCKNFRNMLLPKLELDEIVGPPTVQVYPEVRGGRRGDWETRFSGLCYGGVSENHSNFYD